MIRCLLLGLLLAGLLPAQHDPDALRALLRRNDDFAIALLRAGGGPGEDALLSPASLLQAFGMTWAGTEDALHQELAEVLHFEGPPERVHRALAALRKRLGGEGDAGHALRLANRLWSFDDGGIEPALQELLRRHYGAGVERLRPGSPDASRRHINSWIAEQTRGMIPELLPEGSLDGPVALVLTNAVHFKGRWAVPFDPERTQPGPFRLPDGTTLRVPMMARRGEHALAEAEEVRVLELPFAGDAVAMTFIVPQPGRTLADVERDLTGERLREWRAALRPRTAEVGIPRFTLMVTSALHAKALPALGMRRAFSFTRDWGPLNGDRRELRIAAVHHDAGIVVDEAGSEAAAATGVVLEKRSIPLSFVVDRPFLLTIHHRATGALLFLGRVVHPRAP